AQGAVMTMKTIGVLGGIGPQATMDFEARVHAVSQRLIPAQANQGYPPMVVAYLRHAPVLLDDQGVTVRPGRLDPRLLETARRLGTWADFLVITSNGVHRYLEEIEAAAGRPVLSMIEVTLEEVGRRGWRRVGVLTFIEPGVYQRPLEERGLGCEVLSEDQQRGLDAVILPYMAGQGGPAASATVREAVDTLRARPADGIILGCTELPLLLGEDAEAPDLINPTQLLAEAAVRAAIA
ncbi:MAG TPA: amino acid racemase, partial [Chloroflexota bacterium]|nr:amino acid racemase [Chloroflexota bacterium]